MWVYRVGESKLAPRIGDFVGIGFHDLSIGICERPGFFGDGFGHWFDYCCAVVRVQSP